MPATLSTPLPHLAVTIDGGRVGDVRAVGGLAMTADISTNDLGPDNVAKKHVANIGWTPGSLMVGMGMGTALAGWLQRSFAGGASTVSGAVTMADAQDRAQSAVTFANALITRCAFPALDVASKDPAALTVEYAAEQVRLQKGDGSSIGGLGPAAKPWLCSGFRLEVGALPCAHVLRIEPMSWTATVTGDQIGIFREPGKTQTKVIVPDLTISIANGDRQAWADAATAWFVDGKHLEADEMQGALTLLGPDNTALARVALKNMGFKTFQTLPAAGDGSDRFTVTLYVEAMTFEAAADAGGIVRPRINPLLR